MDVYILIGGYAGNELNIGAWGAPAAKGVGTGIGSNNPSQLNLNTTVTLSSNTTYGIALVLDHNHDHRYTNGTWSNSNYINSDVSLSLGSASNNPFGVPILSGRIWNGTIYYTINPAIPISNWAIFLGIFLIGIFMIIRYRKKLA